MQAYDLASDLDRIETSLSNDSGAEWQTDSHLVIAVPVNSAKDGSQVGTLAVAWSLEQQQATVMSAIYTQLALAGGLLLALVVLLLFIVDRMVARPVRAVIEAIGRKIAEMDEISTAIALAVEEQGASTGEISSNSQQAAAGTQEVTTTIAEVNKAALETGTAANQVLQSAGDLAGQADQLRGEVDKFLETMNAA